LRLETINLKIIQYQFFNLSGAAEKKSAGKSVRQMQSFSGYNQGLKQKPVSGLHSEVSE